MRKKCAACKCVRAVLAVGGSISESIRDRGATQPPAHFHRNPSGRASFGRLLCRSSVEDHSGYSPSSLRASSRNTQRRHYTSHGLGALVPVDINPKFDWRPSIRINHGFTLSGCALKPAEVFALLLVILVSLAVN